MIMNEALEPTASLEFQCSYLVAVHSGNSPFFLSLSFDKDKMKTIIVVVPCLISIIKYLRKTLPKMKPVEKSLWQEQEAPGHIVPAARQLGVISVHVFSVVFGLRSLPVERCCLHSG